VAYALLRERIILMTVEQNKGGEMNRNKIGQKMSRWAAAIAITGVCAVGCAGGPMTAREKGAGIGALGGAAAGGLIGNAVRHPAAGAAIGAGVGLGAGALIGDYMQGQ
jgi:hypothetical protein